MQKYVDEFMDMYHGDSVSIREPLVEKVEPIETIDEALSKYSEGDKLRALVIEVKSSKQKLTLSLRDYYRMLQKEEIAKYIHDESDEDKASIADFIKNKPSK